MMLLTTLLVLLTAISTVATKRAHERAVARMAPYQYPYEALVRQIKQTREYFRAMSLRMEESLSRLQELERKMLQ